MSPIISVIMPCFNGSGTISKAIDSVLFQNFKNFELIVVDDNSTDNSLKIIEDYRNSDERVIKISNSTGAHGVSYARNLALEHAKGRFICFLDCDDYLTQNSLKHRVEKIVESNAVVVFGSYLRLENESNFIPVYAKDSISFKDMLKRNMIGNLTGMYDSQKIGKIFQKNIAHEDYLMWCEILQLCRCAVSTGRDYLGVYRVSSKSLSGNKFKAAIWHWGVLRKGLKVNFFYAIIFQMYYMCSSLLNRIFHPNESVKTF